MKLSQQEVLRQLDKMLSYQGGTVRITPERVHALQVAIAAIRNLPKTKRRLRIAKRKPSFEETILEQQRRVTTGFRFPGEI